MQKILFVLFLLCFSVTNTAYAVDMDRGIDSFVEKVDKPAIVSTSKALDVPCFDFGIKGYRAYKLERLGSVSQFHIGNFLVNSIVGKWVWRSSLKDPIRYRNINQLINA